MRRESLTQFTVQLTKSEGREKERERERERERDDLAQSLLGSALYQVNCAELELWMRELWSIFPRVPLKLEELPVVTD